MAKIDLEFLARQIERVITDLATLKDDAMVVMARSTGSRPACRAWSLRFAPCTAATDSWRDGSSASDSIPMWEVTL
jgi:hypothetical protein